MIKEVCCATLEAVYSAHQRGAQRVELCTALEVGGVTPSAGMVEQALKIGIPVNVLVRLRSGNFIYNKEEVDAMCSDIRHFVAMGVHGIVLGALTPEGEIDLAACQSMIKAAGSVPVTFHRAFDVCSRPFEALEQIIALGCSRLLTSGQASTAPDGTTMLRRLVEQADGRIIILAGCGITPQNVARLVEETGVKEVHGSRL